MVWCPHCRYIPSYRCSCQPKYEGNPLRPHQPVMTKEMAHFWITGKHMQKQTQEQINEELEYNDHLTWKRGDGDAPCGFLFIGIPPSKEDAPEGYVTGSCGTKFQRSNVMLNSNKMRLVLTPDTTGVEVTVKKSVFMTDPDVKTTVLEPKPCE